MEVDKIINKFILSSNLSKYTDSDFRKYHCPYFMDNHNKKIEMRMKKYLLVYTYNTEKI